MRTGYVVVAAMLVALGACSDSDAVGDMGVSPDKGATADRGVGQDRGAAADMGPPREAGARVDAAPAGTACASGAKAFFSYASNMVICETAGLFDQCAAAKVCGTGWHLCGGTEFLARGGKTTPTPDNASAIVGACIRLNGKMQAPSDKICGVCKRSPSTFVARDWACSSGKPGLGSTDAYIGVYATTGCRRIGLDVASTAGFWRAATISGRVKRAVCCS